MLSRDPGAPQLGVKVWLAFAAVSFFWGTTYLAIRIGVETMPPLLMAGMRHTAGGILLCGYFLLRGHKLPTPRVMGFLAINGTLMLVIANGCVTFAEKYVNSGLSALICSLTPVFMIAFSAFGREKETITGRILLGLLVCLTGQAVLFSDNLKDFANPSYQWGMVALFIANASWAYGSVFSRRVKHNLNPLFAAGLQMISGGLILDVAGTLKGEWAFMHPEPASIWALVYLVTFGSVVAYGAYMYMLKAMPASAASSYAYINTVVAVLLGWLWAGEKMNFATILAVVLTTLGVYLLNRSMQRKKAS